MITMSRRSAFVALGGSALSGIATGAWFRRGPAVAASAAGRGAPGTGAVAVLAARRGTVGAAGGDGHGGHTGVGSSGHHGWSGTVVADLEVHNPSRRPLLVSPGQFRLRIGRTGPTVSFYDSERAVGVLSAGASVRMWISYLAPPEATELSLEYAAAGATAPVALPLSIAGSAVAS